MHILYGIAFFPKMNHFTPKSRTFAVGNKKDEQSTLLKKS